MFEGPRLATPGISGHRAGGFNSLFLKVGVYPVDNESVAPKELAAFVEQSRARMRCGLGEVAGGKGGLTSPRLRCTPASS
jgi:hypothetical protein